MLPKEIGPHEGVEFDLIKQGKKQLAYFCHDYPGNDHYEQAKKLSLNLIEFSFKEPNQDQNLLNVVFYRIGYYDQAEQLVEALQLAHTKPFNWHDIEFKIGSLLGYTPHEVQVFVKHFKAVNS